VIYQRFFECFWNSQLNRVFVTSGKVVVHRVSHLNPMVVRFNMS